MLAMAAIKMMEALVVKSKAYGQQFLHSAGKE